MLLGAIMLLSISFVFASTDFPPEQISKEKATEDILFYFSLIDRQHGNPYEYISRDEFKTLVDSKIIALPSTISNQQFSTILLELNQNIRCGHTTVTLDTKLIRKAADQADFFPFPISIIENEIFIDFEDGNLPHASKILSIDGITAQEILKDLTLLTITDGFIETKRKRELESKFGYYFFLKYGPKATFDVDYSFNQNEASTIVKGTTGNVMLANNYYRPLYKSHERYYHFTHLDAIDSLHTLVLTLNTFQANPEWFYERISSRYNKVSKQFDFENLVLDLRGNEGGDRRLLNILYQIIAGKDVFDPSETYVRSKNIIEKENLIGINGAFNSDQVLTNAEDYLNKYFVISENDKFSSETKNWYDEFKLDFDMNNIKFKGHVYVLTSGRTFSAAADLSRILGDLDNVTLVGEETGGAYEARTANMLLNYALPNSKLNIQVPVIYEKFINADKMVNVGRGTFPDYFITQSFDDLVNKRDAVFDFTLNLIEQNSLMGTN